MHIKENKKRFMNFNKTHKSGCKLSHNLLPKFSIFGKENQLCMIGGKTWKQLKKKTII